jgi:hypothetical protein
MSLVSIPCCEYLVASMLTEESRRSSADGMTDQAPSEPIPAMHGIVPSAIITIPFFIVFILLIDMNDMPSIPRVAPGHQLLDDGGKATIIGANPNGR